MKVNKKLILFPQTYPHKGGDQVFVTNELKTISPQFDQIVIIHFKENNTEKIMVPPNVEVLYLKSLEKINIFSILTQKEFYMVLASEFNRLNFKLFFKYFGFIVSSYKQAFAKIRILENENLLDNKSLYYSFWMNDSAFLLAIAKSKNMISTFFFRLHGYDLIDEFRPDNYIPFRNFNFSQVTMAFTVSLFGLNYLKQKVKDVTKIENSYLGSFDLGLNTFDKNQFVIVSCSSINIRKRVTLIAKSLAEINDINIKWIHIGEKGDWGVANDLIKFAKEILPPNITFVSKGYLTNEALMHFYKTQPITSFIHLSETEGGPSIACVEAISFGIPLIATTVGGLKEIVNSKTGIPLSENPEISEVAKAIQKINSNTFQSIEFRKGVKDFWMENFDAEKNGKRFIKYLN